jgi:hypothetical protein
VPASFAFLRMDEMKGITPHVTVGISSTFLVVAVDFGNGGFRQGVSFKLALVGVGSLESAKKQNEKKASFPPFHLYPRTSTFFATSRSTNACVDYLTCFDGEDFLPIYKCK